MLYSTLNDRRCHPGGTPGYKLKAICTHTLGCHPCRGGPFSSRVFPGLVLPLSARPALGDAHSRICLLVERQRKQQWDRTQFHSQPLLPLRITQSSLWSHPVNRMLFFANILRCG